MNTSFLGQFDLNLTSLILRLGLIVIVFIVFIVGRWLAGELSDNTPVTITVHPGVIKVIVP